MYSNQNLAINGAPITSVSTAVFPKERMIEAQQGYFDSSILSSIIDFDPNKGMLLLQTAWDKQVMKKQSFANNIYRKVVTDNAILNVNGRDGGKFKYKVAIETDNCLRTVDDTSDQSVDGFIFSISFQVFISSPLPQEPFVLMCFLVISTISPLSVLSPTSNSFLGLNLSSITLSIVG
jgi:hypothetical protein